MEDLLVKLPLLFKEYQDLQILKEGSFYFQHKFIYEEDWLLAWKKYFYSIPVNHKIQITPAWEKPNPDLLNLWLEPKMGFGTGQHPTTYLCLDFLTKENLIDKNMIDIGAGSGILGVAALLMGAKHCDFVENDLLAIDSLKDTINRNDVEEKASVFAVNIFESDNLQKNTYDLGCINIIAEVIIEMIPLAFIKAIPVLILSGILLVKEESVKNTLEKEGYTILERQEQGEWVSYKVTVH